MYLGNHKKNYLTVEVNGLPVRTHTYSLDFLYKDLTTHLNRYEPNHEITAVYANPSPYKVVYFESWCRIAKTLNGTRPSIQSHNNNVYTLAFFAELHGTPCFCYVTYNNAYYMPLSD